ncbi:hypothetical protein GH714_026778 [Hevea brasiliensis]|uniref:CBS domain-containing protein n=1 Tax=Hevea brasiliensis TaxID=3981 RepID=A0A6A6M271_HEVBR|nr:hypothetical protein GH714_026778 [Hevea brasiliensis]
MSEWNKLMEKQDTFRYTTLTKGYSSAEIEGIGVVEVGDIRAYQNVLHQAFDLKMRMTAYWKIVLRRLVDSMALHLQFSVQNLVNKEMEKEIISELISNHGGSIERMLEESPSVAGKREKLNSTQQMARIICLMMVGQQEKKFSSRSIGFNPGSSSFGIGRSMYRGRGAPLTCKLSSSLAAVMAQMLSHRATHVWVRRNGDDVLVGMVGYADILIAVTKPPSSFIPVNRSSEGFAAEVLS